MESLVVKRSNFKFCVLKNKQTNKQTNKQAKTKTKTKRVKYKVVGAQNKQDTIQQLRLEKRGYYRWIVGE